MIAAPDEAPYHVIIENDVRIKMRDGVELVADIYRPRGEGNFPVLLERTPYNRKGESGMAHELSAHGYVVVLQDTRGRYDSGGEFYPFRDESQDGYDTVEWAAQLDYADGKVGMFGGSYRNPNTGEPMLGASRMVNVRQTIYHDSKYISF